VLPEGVIVERSDEVPQSEDEIWEQNRQDFDNSFKPPVQQQ